MEYVFASLLGLLGTLFGSFASVLISRIRNKSGGIVAGRSECPYCTTKLSPFELIPIVSYIFLRGKCRHCKAEISPIYPLLEIATGILFALCGVLLVDASMILSGNTEEFMRLVFFLAVSFVTVVFVFYDILYMEIPDEVMLPSLGVIILTLFVGSLGFGSFFFSHYIPFDASLFNVPIANAVLGATTIFTFFLIQILVSEGKWMGGGDLRIALFMGLVGGFKIALLGLMLGYIYGSVIGLFILAKKRERDIQIPFGPYLALGLFTSLFFYEPIIRWYLNIL